MRNFSSKVLAGHRSKSRNLNVTISFIKEIKNTLFGVSDMDLMLNSVEEDKILLEFAEDINNFLKIGR
jgi:hypothetical protein